MQYSANTQSSCTMFISWLCVYVWDSLGVCFAVPYRSHLSLPYDQDLIPTLSDAIHEDVRCSTGNGRVSAEFLCRLCSCLSLEQRQLEQRNWSHARVWKNRNSKQYWRLCHFVNAKYLWGSLGWLMEIIGLCKARLRFWPVFPLSLWGVLSQQAHQHWVNRSSPYWGYHNDPLENSHSVAFDLLPVAGVTLFHSLARLLLLDAGWKIRMPVLWAF